MAELRGMEGISFAFDREANEPLYRQLRRLLQDRLVSGEWEPNLRLPSSRELATELGLSRNTVNAAYLELVAEGYLVARPRSGLYINEEIASSPRTGRGDEQSSPRPLDWGARLQPSRDAGMPEIEKVGDWQHYPYPFVAGQVDPRSFPAAAWARTLREALYPPHLHYSLSDAIAADDPLLVEMLRRHILPSRGIDARPEEILITVGSQQGLHLLASSLLGVGTTVAVEDPGYLDARRILVRSGAKLLPLPVDGSGVVPPETLNGVSAIYLTPSHQHPTNVTLSVGRRQRLLRLAEEADAILFEDDYDSELRYIGSPTAALKSLDHANRVVYLGTFSKFLAPGLRMGYLVGAAELIDHLRSERRYSIRHPPGQLQRALALFIQSGQYHSSVRHHRTLLRRKWEAMVSAIDEFFPWPVPAPPGGVSIWVNGPEGLDCESVVRDALTRGVIIERGDIFFSDVNAGRHCLRLGYGVIPLESIAPGIRILGQLVQKYRGARGMGRSSALEAVTAQFSA